MDIVKARVAVIPGDGVGREVTPVATEVLAAAAGASREIDFSFEGLPWGSDHYRATGHMMDPDGLDILRQYDAILFGAVGDPAIADHVTLWGLRLAIVQGFDLAVSLRPMRLLPGVSSPLAHESPLDVVVVRENTEGEYSGVGGFAGRDTPGEMALQTTVFTRRAIERVARFAFEFASQRKDGRLASITKSNAMAHAGVLWDKVVGEVAREFSAVPFESILVDAAAARLVLEPSSFDVLVASNLHGDILSDLTGALGGGLGMAASANLSLDGSAPSMFEPVHGSAPAIVGRGIANPIGAVLSAAMLCDALGAPETGSLIRSAVESVCAAGVLTPDIGGTATTAAVAEELLSTIDSQSRAG